VALQGTLDTFALPDVLRLLAATKKSGRLRITGGRGTGSAWVAQGEIVGIEATHVAHATEPVDALFELLRFQEGAFTFDADAVCDNPGKPADVESLLGEAESLLEEWHAIEAVVPSLDAWVTLRKQLPQSEVVVSQDQWTTLVAVGGGATVRRVADEVCQGELPVSRSVKDLVELGLLDIAAVAPAGTVHASTAPLPAPREERPLVAVDDRPLFAEEDSALAPAPAPTTTRSRRNRAAAAAAPAEPEVFVPLDLPGHGPAPSYDRAETEVEVEPDVDGATPGEVDDLAAAFPGLANRSLPSTADLDDEELAKQLATLSPRAANAILAAAEAETDEEREAALDAVEDEDQPLNRGLLLKFLSSVKS
jgi:hypothetical protein